MRTISLLTLFNGVISFNGICWQLEKYRMSPGYFLKFMTVVLVRRINPPPVKIGMMDSLQECSLLLASFCIWCLKGWCQLNIMYTNLSVLPLMFIIWCFIWRFIQYVFWGKSTNCNGAVHFWRSVFFVWPCLSQCYWHRLFSWCLFLYLLPTRLGSEICRSRPQNSNISTAVGCFHKTRVCGRHLNGRDISSIYYPSWPKIVFVLHSEGSAAFPISKDTVLTLKGIGKMRKDVDVRRFHSIQSIYFL